MSAFLVSFLAVAIAEIGDKTQLLALLLAARYRQPFAIAAGIAIATLANHALASWLGAEAAARLPHATLVWLVALSFAAVGLWALKPDRIEDDAVERGGVRGAFAASLVAFFLAEMGDKTQIATVVLAAQYQPLWQVLLGTTLGLMAANAPVLWLGARFADRIPARATRVATAVLFLALAAAVVWRG